MRHLWLVVLFGCAAAQTETDALLSKLPTADVNGCLAAHVGALVQEPDTELMLTAWIPIDTERSRSTPYEAGEVFEATVADDAQLRVQIGPSLTQNWPCSHLPFEPDRTGQGDEGELTLTVVDQVDDSAAGGRVMIADVSIRGGSVVMEDGTTHALPDLDYANVRFPLDVE